MKRILITCLALLTAAGAAQGQLQQLWQKANADYAAGRYAKAQASYEHILQQGYFAPGLYYDLGNSFFKQNQIGRAIINYKRALRYAPDNPDYRHNLSFAQRKALDAIETPPQSLFKRLRHWTLSLFEMKTWARFSLLFSSAGMLAFALYYFSSAPSRKRLFFGLFFLFLIATPYAYLGARYQRDKGKNRKQAYVVVSNVMVKNAPAVGSGDAFMLHDGAPVILIKRMNSWYRIRLADGKTGWIPYSAVAPL